MSQLTDVAAEQKVLPERGAEVADRVRRAMPAIAVFALGLVVWESLVAVFQIQTFILPRPSLIAQTFVQEMSVVIPAGLYTMRQAVGGFLIGSALGILIALATARWTTVAEGLMPFAIAVNATPIVALAPIMNQWFGTYNPGSKMAIVAVMVFFPVMINAVRGLTLVDAGALELMRSYAASEFTILRRLRIPNALPYILNALKVSSTLSVIGAIVSEYFGGTRDALGFYISQQAALTRFANAWSAIIVACFMGIVFYALLLLIERLVMPWHVSLRNTE
ncbi:MAG: ABC transporter permease [Anaerolineales bacterium]